MKDATEMASREKTRRRITRANVVATLVVCAAYLSYLWIWPMYREYDRIPFTWSALELHKAVVLIPWLAIAIAYARPLLFIGFFAHTPGAVICALVCAWSFVFRMESPEDKLDLAYQLLNFGSQRLVLVSLFSLPFALLSVVLYVAALWTRRVQQAGEAIPDPNPSNERLPPRSGFTWVELLVVIAIIGQFIVLLGPQEARIYGPGTIERFTAQWITKYGIDPHDVDRPEDSLVARDISIVGRWQHQWNWVDVIPASDDGSYLVGAGRSTARGPAIQRRSGRFRNGELILDRPVLNFGSIRACTRFFFIRWHGQEMLISSVNVEEFNEYKEGKVPESGAQGWTMLVMFRRSGGTP